MSLSLLIASVKLRWLLKAAAEFHALLPTGLDKVFFGKIAAAFNSPHFWAN